MGTVPIGSYLNSCLEDGIMSIEDGINSIDPGGKGADTMQAQRYIIKAYSATVTA